MKKFDLCLAGNGRPYPWNHGFFEKKLKLYMDKSEEYDTYRIGDCEYRIIRPAYPEVKQNCNAYNKCVDFLKELSSYKNVPLEKVEETA